MVGLLDKLRSRSRDLSSYVAYCVHVIIFTLKAEDNGSFYNTCERSCVFV